MIIGQASSQEENIIKIFSDIDSSGIFKEVTNLCPSSYIQFAYVFCLIFTVLVYMRLDWEKSSHKFL